jgi:hypothetical protein
MDIGTSTDTRTTRRVERTTGTTVASSSITMSESLGVDGWVEGRWLGHVCAFFRSRGG